MTLLAQLRHSLAQLLEPFYPESLFHPVTVGRRWDERL